MLDFSLFHSNCSILGLSPWIEFVLWIVLFWLESLKQLNYTKKFGRTGHFWIHILQCTFLFLVSCIPRVSSNKIWHHQTIDYSSWYSLRSVHIINIIEKKCYLIITLKSRRQISQLISTLGTRDETW